ncbi:MAG TPA: CBS domain-containing protein [Bacteroidetes bacterium]|nr:CBS domain-containing protein [Bacteroidota bacterium]
MQTKVSDLLAVKGSDVICINRNVSVFEANKTLVNNNVGAVLVRDEKEKLAGIYTERDVLKQSVRRSDQLKTTLVKDVMTTDLIIGLSDDKIDYLMGIMTFNKIRHIPILENGEIRGVISIGDLVKSQLHDARYENRYLKDYIMGKYPG